VVFQQGTGKKGSSLFDVSGGGRKKRVIRESSKGDKGSYLCSRKTPVYHIITACSHEMVQLRKKKGRQRGGTGGISNKEHNGEDIYRQSSEI